MTSALPVDSIDFVQYITVKKRLAPKSVQHCRQRLAIFLDWMNERNVQLSGQSIEGFLFDLKAKGLKNNSVNTYIFMLRYLKDYCEDRGIPSGFLTNFRNLPKNTTFIDVLSNDEVERLYRTLLTYGIYHGQDYTEALN